MIALLLPVQEPIFLPSWTLGAKVEAAEFRVADGYADLVLRLTPAKGRAASAFRLGGKSREEITISGAPRRGGSARFVWRVPVRPGKDSTVDLGPVLKGASFDGLDPILQAHLVFRGGRLAPLAKDPRFRWVEREEMGSGFYGHNTSRVRFSVATRPEGNGVFLTILPVLDDERKEGGS